MSEVERYYMRYVFTNALVNKVVDVAGVVHETEPDINRMYPRHTRCEQDWAKLEPVNQAPGDPPTTCIACIAGGRSSDDLTKLAQETFDRRYGIGKGLLRAMSIHKTIDRIARKVK